MEGFYIAGGALAVWALVVSALGVMREDFPSTRGATRLVAAISIVLVVAAVGLGDLPVRHRGTRAEEASKTH